ncbi:fimbrial protein [Serratia sp. 2723]|uniref:fimbrial protein n=1 Tax=unclassified Serratia (in: enterobacteria) TaxID=2647522 RepID=UPI003D1C2D50
MTGNKNRAYWLTELRYYGSLVALAMSVPVSLATAMLLLPSSQAADNRAVDGANGTLSVQGALTESACRLEMDSARQDIQLGETGTGRLWQVGDRGEPVAFELRLKDCLRSPAGSGDVRTGGLTWADNQPAVSVSFKATRDADNPQLVKAQGVSGMGLRMANDRGQDVRLGSWGQPLLLAPGQNTLIYTVAPERTLANLIAGSYRAVVDFHLSYD